jgi:hypothetical protein
MLSYEKSIEDIGCYGELFCSFIDDNDGKSYCRFFDIYDENSIDGFVA